MLRLTFFLVINFAALAIGSLLMGNPATNEWYIAQHKAPWTPPGWVFGAAWMIIMLCFSFFLFFITKTGNGKQHQIIYILFAVQFVLNVIWNPVFFKQHNVALALILIVLLTLLVWWFVWWGFKNNGKVGFLVLPYGLWLLIATSLNAYVLLKN